MGRKKKKSAEERFQEAHPDWTVSEEMTVNGRKVEIGTEVSIKGEPGRFKFLQHVTTPSCEWVDVIGGRKGYVHQRSFRPDRVKTVHRLKKIRPKKGVS